GEIVGAVLLRGDRSDRLDEQRQAGGGRAGEDERSALSDLHEGGVALVYLQNDPIGVERRQLEEHLAALDGGRERLAEVARHHDGVEGGGDARARELTVEQRHLGPCLIHLRGQDHHLRGVAQGERLL